jgi:1-acyl-sn-glycerol-3-phosphate acyltransferase
LEDLMVILKVLFLLVAGLLSLLAMRHVVREMQAVKVRSQNPRAQRYNRSHVRLRQDPRTGVYYPEG